MRVGMAFVTSAAAALGCSAILGIDSATHRDGGASLDAAADVTSDAPQLEAGPDAPGPLPFRCGGPPCDRAHECCVTDDGAGTIAEACVEAGTCTSVVVLCHDHANCSAGRVCCASFADRYHLDAVSCVTSCPVDAPDGDGRRAAWLLCDPALDDCPDGGSCLPIGTILDAPKFTACQ